MAGSFGTTKAQVSVFQETRRGSVYLGLDFNAFALPTSDIHIFQRKLSNQYDLMSVKSDQTADGTIPSPLKNYSLSIGYFVNYNQTWAIEVSYNPFNQYVTANQTVRQKGYVNGYNVDTSFSFSKTAGNSYALTSGTAAVQFNVVKRIPLYRNKERSLSFDLFFKAGLGPALAHPENQLSGTNNVPALSTTAGWNADGSGGLRVMFRRHFFLEAYKKYSYISFGNVLVNGGTASQNLLLDAISVGGGYFFPVTRFNPLFRKGVKRKHSLPNGPEPRGDIPGGMPNQQAPPEDLPPSAF